MLVNTLCLCERYNHSQFQSPSAIVWWFSQWWFVSGMAVACRYLDNGYPGQDFLLCALVLVYGMSSHLTFNLDNKSTFWLISTNRFMHMNADTFDKKLIKKLNCHQTIAGSEIAVRSSALRLYCSPHRLFNCMQSKCAQTWGGTGQPGLRLLWRTLLYWLSMLTLQFVKYVCLSRPFVQMSTKQD